jgi:hypothetical protein
VRSLSSGPREDYLEQESLGDTAQLILGTGMLVACVIFHVEGHVSDREADSFHDGCPLRLSQERSRRSYSRIGGRESVSGWRTCMKRFAPSTQGG